MLVESRQRPGDPFDVGRGRRRVLGGSQERHVGAVPPGHLGDRLAVGGDDDPLEDAALPAVRSRTRGAGCPARTRTFLSATRSDPARAPINATAFGISPPLRSALRLGVGTPSLLLARATEPLIASSSVGCSSRASCAVDVVKSLGKASMIANWSAGSIGAHPRPPPPRTPRPPPRGVASSRARRRGARPRREPTPRWLRPAARAGATFSQSTARSLSADRRGRGPAARSGASERLSVSTETTSEGGGDPRGARPSRGTTTPVSSSPGLEPPDHARDDGRRRRLQQARAGANSLDLLEPVLERQHEGALERAGSDAIE